MATDRVSAALDNPALPLLMTRRQRFLNFVRSRVSSFDVADDILQKASLKVVSRGAEVHDGERAEAWIYRILRNEILDHHRRLAVQQKRTAELTPEIAATPTSGEGNLCRCALDEMSNLQPNYSQALRSIEMQDEPISRHAGRAGISLNNATVRLHRARKALRARVVQRCGQCAGAGCFDCTCAGSH